MKKIGMIVMVCLLGVTAVWAADQQITGRVTKVIDGNTLEVLGTDNQVYKLILVGIDSPELGQAYGLEAKNFLEKLVLKKVVTVYFHGKDKKGNILAVITIERHIDPRSKLLKEGLAWTAERNPAPELEIYRQKAVEKAKGLWKEEDPTPPWVFRRQQTMLKAKSS